MFLFVVFCFVLIVLLKGDNESYINDKKEQSTELVLTILVIIVDGTWLFIRFLSRICISK